MNGLATLASIAQAVRDGMGTAKAALVFHHAPKPVSVNEFSDALHAVCRPRYPNARVMRAAHLGRP